MKKLFYLYLLFSLFTSFSSLQAISEEQEAEASNFKVNNTDALEVLPDRIILQGNVSITSLGGEADNNFTLSTSKLVSLKNAAGEYGDIECFGISNIKSSKFTLRANKLFFRKDLKTKKYTRLEAFGDVNVLATDSSQNLKAPRVFIDLINKKLLAYDGVKARQIIEDKGKKQKVDILSVEQEIDLNSNLSTGKQLIAKKSVITSLEGEANIFSEYMELYKTKGQMEKAVFSGANTYLLTKDNVRGDGDPIIYYLQSKVLNIMSPANGNKKAKLTKTDGTIIEGDFIEYGTETKSLKVRSKNSEKSEVQTADGTIIRGEFIDYTENSLLVRGGKEKAYLKLPASEKNGSQGELVIMADMIENKEISPTESLLTAQQNNYDENDLVELNYGLKKGWGKKLLINQDKSVLDKQNDYLILVDKAHLIDPEKKQNLFAPIIKIGLGNKNLESGITGRAKGFIPMTKNNTTK